MVISLSAIAVLLILSAFFSGSETALTAASRPLMHQFAQSGNKRAQIVNELHEHKDRLIGAILLGNNLVNILASALATSILIGLFGEAGVVYATIAMTLLILVFAEIMPKTYAFKKADRMALAVAPPVRTLVVVLSPFTRATSLFVTGVFYLFGIGASGKDAMASNEEELRGAIELHDGQTPDIREKRDMLRSVLDLGEVWVAEIMLHRKDVVVINADDSPRKIVEQVLASPYTRIPLYQGSQDEILGVLHAKDLLRALRAAEGIFEELDIVSLAAKPWFIPESTTLLDQLQAFRRRREHFSLVVDEYGALLGIVTLEDILEEIVGDISDEHDVATRGVHPNSDGTYTIGGTVTIRDLNRRFEWDLPDEEAATLAGLVLHEVRRIPEEGQAFLFHQFRFEIERRENHRLTHIRLTPPGRG